MKDKLRLAYNEYQREYRKKNLERIREYRRKYMAEYRRKNPDYYLKELERSRK